MSNNLIPAERRQRIVDILSDQGAVRVDNLGQQFDVSEMTIRRDLVILEKNGRLERTHGGALAIHYVAGESPYSVKDQANRSLKEVIGRRAAELIEDGETVFINGGSTALQVILHLAYRRGIRVVTNNIAAAMALPEDTELDLILVGGQYRRQSGCTVGDFASRVLGEIMPTRAILGTDGLTVKAGMTSPIQQEAALTRMMLERIRGQVVVVADHKKIGRVASFFTAPISVIDVLITDRKLDDSVFPDFEETGITIVPVFAD